VATGAAKEHRPKDRAMDCEHHDVRLTSESVPLRHVVSIVNWFTCEACGERAAVVEKAAMFELGQSSSSRWPTTSQ
jgi:hypothetical protein